ncbi:MAG: UDP-N-acetylmuramate dehydrogenase [Candidatus Pacebacteria bacterium]|nr:UDP-N-acetylmuramate dehydrogenase [Candidatus Paceibacterota bacterium]
MKDVKSLNIQKNISFLKYTTFKIGGPAKFFCVVENVDEIKEALEFAEKNKLDIFIFGGGSNILVSDKGFDGLVIKINNQKLEIKNNEINVEGGFPFSKLVSESVKNNLTGLEWAAGIPGTVGGAICNNAGAHGKSIQDIIEKVEIIEIVPLDKGGWGVRKLTNQECSFSYRNSIFKSEKKYIILSAILKCGIYPLGFQEDESRKIISGYLETRKQKQSLEYPSAGSVFKNPEIEGEILDKILIKYPELKEIIKDNIVPVGWFVEELGLKGKKIGGAMISEKHGNFIVNTGSAKAEDVVILISLIKQKVRNRFGVQLQEEIEYVGF